MFGNGIFSNIVSEKQLKVMKKEEIIEYLGSGDLKASEIVKFSGGLIGLNQASGWVRKLRRGEDLSNPVLVMMWKILVERNSWDKPRRSVYMPMGSFGNDIPDGFTPTFVPNIESKCNDMDRLDRIENILKEMYEKSKNR